LEQYKGEKIMESKELIVFDYKTIRVARDLETVANDAYIALGYEPTGAGISDGAIFNVNLSFKRDRKIKNKSELLKLQDKIDITIANIETLRKAKDRAGDTVGLTTGIVGALTLGGGMSIIMTTNENLLNNIPLLAGGIAVGVVGIGICGFAWSLRNKIHKLKSTKIAAIIESEYDKLADLTEAAHKLLQNS
jgi:hypothetical protein